MTYVIKLNIEFADAILDGDKNFEFRLNDRGYQKGDYVCFATAGDYVYFATVDDFGVRTHHEIEKIRYQIAYALGGWGIENGYVVLGIKEADDD